MEKWEERAGVVIETVKNAEGTTNQSIIAWFRCDTEERGTDTGVYFVA